MLAKLNPRINDITGGVIAAAIKIHRALGPGLDDLVVVELKSVRRLAPIHLAQVLTYLKLTGYPVGLLINFNVVLLKNGIRRVINPNARP
jgi:hypothetical protein